MSNNYPFFNTSKTNISKTVHFLMYEISKKSINKKIKLQTCLLAFVMSLERVRTTIAIGMFQHSALLQTSVCNAPQGKDDRVPEYPKTYVYHYNN